MRLYKYTPGLIKPEVLRKTLIGREEELKFLDRILKSASSGRSFSHAMLIGAKGIGKTHILRIIYHTVRGEIKTKGLKNYKKHFIPVISPEEEYIDSLEKFILLVLGYLNELKPEGIPPIPQEAFESIIFGDRERELIFSYIRTFKEKTGKILLLLIDNVDEIIGNFTEEDQSSLRDILMTSDSVLLISTAPTLFDSIVDHDKPLYNFFEVIWLNEFSFEETEELLEKYAEIEERGDLIEKLRQSEPKLRAIHELAGGNPRLILSLYQIIAEGDITSVEKTFLRILDELSPYFRERMKDITKQQREIIDVMARAKSLLTPTEIASLCRMPVNVVNSQMKRLEKAGYIRKSTKKRVKRVLYEIRERLFSFWRQMRVEAGRRRIGFIVRFLEIWYTKKELVTQLDTILLEIKKVVTLGKTEINPFMDRAWYIKDALAVPEISDRLEAEIAHYKGDYKMAANSLIKYLKHNPEDHDAWYNLGYAYSKLQRYKDAIDAYKKVIEVKPDKHEAWHSLGIAYSELQRHEDAIDAYKKAMEIKPDRYEAWYNLGVLYLIFFGKNVFEGNEEVASQYLKSSLECLSHVTEYQGLYESFASFLKIFLEGKKTNIIKIILKEIEDAGQKDLLEFLSPYSALINYLDTKDSEIIERLRREERTIVQEMLKLLEGKTDKKKTKRRK